MSHFPLKPPPFKTELSGRHYEEVKADDVEDSDYDKTMQEFFRWFREEMVKDMATRTEFYAKLKEGTPMAFGKIVTKKVIK